MKYCLYCQQFIEENNPETKWCMNITKKGQKIIEFEAFHLECWREFLKEEGVEIVERESVKL